MIVTDDGDGPSIDVDHLATVIAAVAAYERAWRDYERAHRPPEDEQAWYRWQEAGPEPDEFAVGLSDFAVMSSGEAASLRLLATLASEPTPFRLSDLCSLDQEGERLVADWMRVVHQTYARSQSLSFDTGAAMRREARCVDL